MRLHNWSCQTADVSEAMQESISEGNWQDGSEKVGRNWEVTQSMVFHWKFVPQSATDVTRAKYHMWAKNSHSKSLGPQHSAFQIYHLENFCCLLDNPISVSITVALAISAKIHFLAITTKWLSQNSVSHSRPIITSKLYVLSKSSSEIPFARWTIWNIRSQNFSQSFVLRFTRRTSSKLRITQIHQYLILSWSFVDHLHTKFLNTWHTYSVMTFTRIRSPILVVSKLPTLPLYLSRFGYPACQLTIRRHIIWYLISLPLQVPRSHKYCCNHSSSLRV
jgi:hypothetical protein